MLKTTLQAGTLFVFALALILLPAGSTLASDLDIHIVTTKANRALHDIAMRIDTHLDDERFRTTVIDIESSLPDKLKNADIVVSTGRLASQHAARHLDEHQILISITGHPLPHGKASKHAQLILQQPLCMQFALIKALSGKFQHISIINRKPQLDHKIRQCADKYKLKANIIQPDENEPIKMTLARAFDADVLLAIADQSIYNQNTVKNILLHAYRKRVPVIGFSGAFVKAGALAAIHSSPEQIARQISEWIVQYALTGTLATTPAHPQYYQVLINRQVSKALEIDLPDAGTVKSALQHEVDK